MHTFVLLSGKAAARLMSHGSMCKYRTTHLHTGKFDYTSVEQTQVGKTEITQKYLVQWYTLTRFASEY